MSKRKEESEEEILISKLIDSDLDGIAKVRVFYQGTDTNPGFEVELIFKDYDKLEAVWEALYKNAMHIRYKTAIERLKIDIKDRDNYESRIVTYEKCNVCGNSFKNTVMKYNKKTGTYLCEECYNSIDD